MGSKKLNGSSDLLAQAISAVFQETQGPAVELMSEIKDEMAGIKKEMHGITDQVTGVNSRLDYHQKALDGIKNG